MRKYLVGSKMLKLDNCRDTDYMYIKEENEVSDEKGRTVRFQNFIIESFIRTKDIKSDPCKSWLLYQVTTGFHEEDDYPFKFDIRDYKDQWIKHLQAYLNDADVERRYTERGEILPKEMYHFEYQYHMILENKLWLDGEAKDVVQKIHDLEMPVSYFYELRDKINAL